MYRIAYKFNNGMASDLRFVSNVYQLDKDEIEIFGYKLPNIEDLHDVEYLKNKKIQTEELKIKEELIDIDIKSIRAIREYISQQNDAPQRLKEFESNAILIRSRLNKEHI